MKILITGGAGYLGSVLCEHLVANNHDIVVVDNLLHRQESLFHLLSNPHIEFIRGDVRDETLMRRIITSVDVIIPLAAIVGAPACNQEPLLAEQINFQAIQTMNRLRSLNQLVIFPVTNSGYGTKSGDVFCTEDTPLEPISIYGKTKVDAEKELLNSPNTITLRLATIFGLSPRMRLDLMVNHFTFLAATEGYITLFEKDFKRNFVHIRDVADTFIFCLEHSKDMVGRPFNVGLDTANISKAELAQKIKEQVPNFYIHYADIGEDPDKRNYIVSNQRLREAGFEACRSLEEGIHELLKGYRMIRKQHANV